MPHRIWVAVCALIASIVLLGAVACGSSSNPAGPSSSVMSVTVSGQAYFTGAGQTTQLVATARHSDGSEQIITGQAQWQSSRADVMTVSPTGAVTAIKPGKSRVSAVFQDVSGFLDVGVPFVGGAARTVRVVYAVPQGVSFRDDYRRALQNAFVNLQWWYRDQMGGPVFSMHSMTPDECQLPHDAGYYLDDTYNKLVADLQPCQPVRRGAANFAWMVYADVLHGCNPVGRLGVGSLGLALLGRGDLQGLSDSRIVQSDCGLEGGSAGIGRYLGGSALELGHAFGLQHPPGCDAEDPACDRSALMFSGYSIYPNTYLRDDDKAHLAASPYFGSTIQRMWDALSMPR
jgi:hypothetical protein